MVSAVLKGLASFQGDRHEFHTKLLLLLWKIVSCVIWSETKWLLRRGDFEEVAFNNKEKKNAISHVKPSPYVAWKVNNVVHIEGWTCKNVGRNRLSVSLEILISCPFAHCCWWYSSPPVCLVETPPCVPLQCPLHEKQPQSIDCIVCTGLMIRKIVAWMNGSQYKSRVFNGLFSWFDQACAIQCSSVLVYDSTI